MPDLRITEERCVRTRPSPEERGVVGYVLVVLAYVLKHYGLVLRCALQGHPVLSFSCCRSRGWGDYPYIRPLPDEDSRTIERQALRGLVCLWGPR